MSRTVPRLMAALLVPLLAAPAAARADRSLNPGEGQPRCAPLTLFCGDFTASGFGGWDGLNGNTSTPQATSRYFRIVRAGRLPVGRSYLRAQVDENAQADGEPGQRTLVYLFPGLRAESSKTAAFQGSDQWYRSTLAFPKSFRPGPGEWNWVVQWHNWPDGPCCPNLALTVDTKHGGERLSLRVLGGGDAAHPVDGPREARGRRFPVRWFVGDPRLRRGHWYDSLVHVRWSYRASGGLVEWWLDGRRVMSVRTPTLFWYADDGTEGAGESAGPGQAYWMLGYYRSGRRHGRIDRTVAVVFHNGARRGPSRASVAFTP